MTRLLRYTIDRYLHYSNTLVAASVGEFFGTFMLVIFGLGVIIQAELSGHDFISISLGWGLAVAMAVFWSGKLGHGHVNPSVTLAFAFVGRLEWRRVPAYWLAQVLGAFLGAICLFLVYYEKLNNLSILKSNGTFTMDTTGGFFVTKPTISVFGAFVDQFFGTLLLSSCALAITDDFGFKLPDYLHPLMLGLMVTTIVGCFAINAGAALNPARDFGPRLMLSICGWGRKAFSHSNYYFWVPIIAPCLGAVCGALLYEALIGVPLLTKERLNNNPETIQLHKKSETNVEHGEMEALQPNNIESTSNNSNEAAERNRNERKLVSSEEAV